jgi:hypothetical protein
MEGPLPVPTCEVHGCSMETRAVRILYGLIEDSPKISPEYSEAYWTPFPHCDDVILGGCVIWAGQAQVRDKNVCAECCQARDAWLRENFPDSAGPNRLDDF